MDVIHVKTSSRLLLYTPTAPVLKNSESSNRRTEHRIHPPLSEPSSLPTTRSPFIRTLPLPPLAIDYSRSLMHNLPKLYRYRKPRQRNLEVIQNRHPLASPYVFCPLSTPCPNSPIMSCPVYTLSHPHRMFLSSLNRRVSWRFLFAIVSRMCLFAFSSPPFHV